MWIETNGRYPQLHKNTIQNSTVFKEVLMKVQ